MISIKTAFSILSIFLLTSQKCTAQPSEELNLDFEEWSELNYDTYFENNPDEHQIEEPYYGDVIGWTHFGQVHRTTDAISGNYAAVVHQWYSLVEGDLQIGMCNPANPDSKNCKIGLSDNILAITGKYKFIAVDSGVAFCTVLGFGLNNLNNLYDTIVNETFYFAPNNNYESFNIAIAPSDTLVKIDSILLSFTSHCKLVELPGGIIKPDLCPNSTVNCNYLYLDDIRFVTNPTNSSTSQNHEQIKVSPNPIKDRIFINSTATVEDIALYELTGREIPIKLFPNQWSEVSALSSGIYFLKIKIISQQPTIYKLIKL